MKKGTKKVIAIVTAAVCALTATGVGLYFHGNIKSCSLPDNFDKAMQEVNSEKQKGEIRIMTSNLLVSYKSWGGSDARPRAKMFFETVNTYKPDVIGIQEVCGQWHNCISQNKGSYKMLYPVKTPMLMRMTALMYNTETLNLIDKGQLAYEKGNDSRLRRAVWGIFENKETKARFAVISTHFDCIRPDEEELMLSYMEYQTEKIYEISNDLKEKYNVPVFCVGDFNTKNPGDEEFVDPDYDVPQVYEALCEKLTDTKLIAEKTESGAAQDVDIPTWDHIFLNGEAKINRYAVISPEELTPLSDHYPLFVDAELK